ncbi:MAG: adenylate/guanylate cyclase domain-containing protein, partial [Alphaproteobacteria bacterium]
LNSGECSVGNIGSEQRFEYSALGDPVNLASRIEGQSKEYGLDNLIGETTMLQAGDMKAVEIDLIRVKGKQIPARLFTLIGAEANTRAEEFAQLRAAQDAMLAAYRGGDFLAAQAAIDRAMAWAEMFGLAEYYARFTKRVKAMQADPPGPDWDGVYEAKSK